MSIAPTTAPHPVAQALNDIGNELGRTFLERRSAIEAMILATLCGEHAFLFGPPGTAKSALCRDLVSRFTGARYFEQLLSKTRPDQAVLGPYDLPALKEGKFRRQIDGYLLTADFAFLDEVGKMSPTTGHDILAALNERIRHEVGDDGNTSHPIPLRTVFTASNEIPTAESEDAAALWDRLLIRVEVGTIKEPANFEAMLQSKITGQRQQKRTMLAYEDLQAADAEVRAVTLPTEVVDALISLKANLVEQSIADISDRRWGQCVRVLQATAFLAGRKHVEVDDLHALRFVLWEEPTQINTVERSTLKIANPLNEQVLQMMDVVTDFAVKIRESVGKSLSEKGGLGSEIATKLKMQLNELDSLLQKCTQEGRSTTRILEAIDATKAMRRRAMVEMLELGTDD